MVLLVADPNAVKALGEGAGSSTRTRRGYSAVRAVLNGAVRGAAGADVGEGHAGLDLRSIDVPEGLFRCAGSRGVRAHGEQLGPGRGQSGRVPCPHGNGRDSVRHLADELRLAQRRSGKGPRSGSEKDRVTGYDGSRKDGGSGGSDRDRFLGASGGHAVVRQVRTVPAVEAALQHDVADVGAVDQNARGVCLESVVAQADPVAPAEHRTVDEHADAAPLDPGADDLDVVNVLNVDAARRAVICPRADQLLRIARDARELPACRGRLRRYVNVAVIDRATVDNAVNRNSRVREARNHLTLLDQGAYSV